MRRQMLTPSDMEYIYQANKEFGPTWHAQTAQRKAAALVTYQKAQETYIAALDAVNAHPWDEAVGDICAKAYHDYEAAAKEWQHYAKE